MLKLYYSLNRGRDGKILYDHRQDGKRSIGYEWD